MTQHSLGLTISAISFGPDPKDSVRFNLKQKLQLRKRNAQKEVIHEEWVEVVDIFSDEEYFEKTGKESFLIFVKRDNDPQKHLLRRYTDIPNSITYDL